MKNLLQLTRVCFVACLIVIALPAFAQQQKAESEKATAYEKAQRAIAEAQKEIQKAMQEVNRSQKEFVEHDMAKMKRQLEKELAGIDRTKIKEEVEKAFEKARIELQAAEQSFHDSETREAIRQELKMAAENMKRELAQVDKEIKQQLAEAKAQIQAMEVEEEVKASLQKAREELKEAELELKRTSEGMQELKKDGLINDKMDKINIDYKDGYLYINEAKQSKATSDKYRKYFEKRKEVQ